ncbi:MAG: hypothetical protein CVV62_01860 [Tenericutes bacterium HGW-Tenericutes-7]|nr:MAG: hypothetical protein CVV62_01860 [Tenericutes bacterium HGW-Tenericutes-7]
MELLSTPSIEFFLQISFPFFLFDKIEFITLPLFQSVHTLSKGNQQKLAIVSTFLGTPDLIILDEPLSGLDVKTCHIFKDYLKKRRDEGLSILISTHQPELFKDLCSRHIIL